MRQRPCAATNSGVEVLERARRGGVHHAVDSHRAARAIALADAVFGVVSSRGCHFRRAVGDGDSAASQHARTDARTVHAAGGSDGSAADGDVAAGTVLARADASCHTTIVTRLCSYGSTTDDDVAAIIIDRADAGVIA